MTFDVMDHHVLLFLVGVVADFNWENGSLIVDNRATKRFGRMNT